MKINIFALVLLIGLFCSLVQAEDPKAPSNTNDTNDTNESSESLAAIRNEQKFLVKLAYIVDYQYHEPDAGVVIHGKLPQLTIGYTRALAKRRIPAWWSVDMSYASGTLQYDGSINNLVTGAVTPNTTSTSDTIIIARGRFGFSLFDTPTHDLNVYGGLAIWHLTDSLTGIGSYDRSISYLYLPLGAEYVQKSGIFLWSTALEVNQFIFGYVQSKLSQVNSSLPDINTEQYSGFGAKIVISAEWNLGNWTLLTDVYDQYWNIGKSTGQTVVINSTTETFYEPANNTNMIGLELGTRF